MSKYRVGLIAEGKTDIYLIESILICNFPRDKFVFQQLSPTEGELSTGRKVEGFGWRSVYAICRELPTRLEMLRACGQALDLLVIHLDGDVAYSTYRQANIETDKCDLPCAEIKDPVEVAGTKLQRILVGHWLESVDLIKYGIVLCLPFINMEAWVGYFAYPEYRQELGEESTEKEVYRWLLMAGNKQANKGKQLLRQKDGRVRKITQNYQRVADTIALEDWEALKASYVQAKRFALQLSEWDIRIND